MEEVEEVGPDVTTTQVQPKPPYAKTALRKELQRIGMNGNQIFHTAIMTCKGPDTGMSCIVITYDPNDPLQKVKYEFAQKTLKPSLFYTPLADLMRIQCKHTHPYNALILH